MLIITIKFSPVEPTGFIITPYMEIENVGSETTYRYRFSCHIFATFADPLVLACLTIAQIKAPIRNNHHGLVSTFNTGFGSKLSIPR
jgi:hypothetical protein